jgi:hypothetical protein
VKLTDEAVEAAARSVHHERYPWVVWENLKPESREYYRNEVRGPIEAALPHLTDDGATPFELETERISWHRKEGYEAGLSARGATPAIDREALIDAINYEFACYPEGLSFVTALDGGILPPRQVAALAADAALALIGAPNSGASEDDR